MNLDVEFLFTPGCPHAQPSLTLLQEVCSAFPVEAMIKEVAVGSIEQASALAFPGSPTIRVNELDIEGAQVSQIPALACRLYETSRSGTPPRWLLEVALLRALAPAHLLFMCVANSARSQMAEGLARRMAPDRVKISSAGSLPSSVRPEAVAVLNEQGIDASEHSSKGLEAIELDSVEAVITLCAQEVCPTFPGPVPKLHWPLPDPATQPGDELARLEAFQRTIKELEQRLGYLFSGWQ